MTLRLAGGRRQGLHGAGGVHGGATRPGLDIVMIFDECTPYPADHDVAKRSMELPLRWAKRSKIAHGDSPSALFGIVQGGMHEDLRLRSLDGLQEIGFDGLAIGGLSVGEPKEEMIRVLDFLPPQMPADKPRYLMGVGKPEDLVEGAPRRGHVRLCDADAQCAQRLPVRRQRGDQDPQLGTQARRLHARPDLRLLHLQTFFPRLSAPLGQVREMLGSMLNTIHNLRHYQRFMACLREVIQQGTLAAFVDAFYAKRGLPTPPLDA
ncbi:tRNA-guanine transglycosylase [Pseudomonas aeruginosa]